MMAAFLVLGTLGACATEDQEQDQNGGNQEQNGGDQQEQNGENGGNGGNGEEDDMFQDEMDDPENEGN